MFGKFEPQVYGPIVAVLSLPAITIGSACDIEDRARAESSTGTESTTASGDTGDAASDAGESTDGASGEQETESETGVEAIGLCFVESEAKIDDDNYRGWLDYVLVADLGEGEELCRVRFQIERNADAAPECPDCEWTVVLQLGAPEHLVDRDGLCATSQRGLDRAAIDALLAEPFGQGFMEEFVGHESLIVEHDLGAASSWETRAVASWDAELGQLHWRESEGFCSYRRP